MSVKYLGRRFACMIWLYTWQVKSWTEVRKNDEVTVYFSASVGKIFLICMGLSIYKVTEFFLSTKSYFLSIRSTSNHMAYQSLYCYSLYILFLCTPFRYGRAADICLHVVWISCVQHIPFHLIVSIVRICLDLLDMAQLVPL